MSQPVDYRSLVIWRKSIEMAKLIYVLTQKLPDSERHGLVRQMRRAAISIPSNIAEGNARQSRRDYVHFLTMARGSLAELDTQLTIAVELKMLSSIEPVRPSMQEIARMLQPMISRLQADKQV